MTSAALSSDQPHGPTAKNYNSMQSWFRSVVGAPHLPPDMRELAVSIDSRMVPVSIYAPADTTKSGEQTPTQREDRS